MVTEEAKRVWISIQAVSQGKLVLCRGLRMREIMRDYTATGKYKSENILGNQFMEEHEREFFDKNAFVLERQVALLAENYRSGQDDSLYDFIADLEEHEGEYVVDGALLTCTCHAVLNTQEK